MELHPDGQQDLRGGGQAGRLGLAQDGHRGLFHP